MLRGREDQIWRLDRHKQTLLADYTDLVPDVLDALDGAGRHRAYRFLGVGALIPRTVYPKSVEML